jgi:hypothetical protein
MFSTVTGGRTSLRLGPDAAIDLIEQDFLRCLEITILTSLEALRAMRETHARGVRGAAIFDYLHLVAARKAKAARLYTLNVSNFRSFHRPGDPDIIHP